MPVTPKQAVSLRIFALNCAVEAHKKIGSSSRYDPREERDTILETASHFEALLRAPLLEEPQAEAAPPAKIGPLDDGEAHFAVQICTATADFLDRTPHPFVNQAGGLRGRIWESDRTRLVGQLRELVTNVSRQKPQVVGTLTDPAVAHDLIIALQLLKAARHAPLISGLPNAAESANDWAHERDRVVGTLTEAFNLDLSATDGIERDL